MAQFSAFVEFDIDTIDLNRVIRNQLDFIPRDNIFLSAGGFVFEDILGIRHDPQDDLMPASATYLTFLGGSGFTYQGTTVTGGTATLVGELLTVAGGDVPLWEAQDINLPAASIYDAMRTPDTDDDRQLIEQALSGDDLVTLSNGNDNMSGFAGDDFILGQAGDDTLTGRDGDDVLLAGDDDDFVSGGAGDDVLTGEAGNDTLRGGAGSDTIGGGSGDDLVFGSGVDLVSDTIAGQVFRLYQAVFDRVPETGGFFGWTSKMETGALSLTDVAQRFVASGEFQQTYGALDIGDFVTLLYANVLGRVPDATGFSGWTGRLESGELTRSDVLLRFSESAEFQDQTELEALAFTFGELQRTFSDEVFRLYQATLNRVPDLGGFEDWTEALAGGRDLVDVIVGFTNSLEFRTVYGDTENAGFVTLLYQNVLNRALDQPGLTGWLERLDNQGWSREEVVEAFVQSAEFIQNTTSDLIGWMRAQDTDDLLAGQAGDDLVVGGMLPDLIEFVSVETGRDTVVGLEPWDELVFTNFGYVNAADARENMVQAGADVVFADQGVTAVFLDTTLMEIEAVTITV